MLNRPCKSCPFLRSPDAVKHLHDARAAEITDTLLGDGSFTCHSTYYSEAVSEHCVGAMLILEKIHRPNQWMRIAGRLGIYKPGGLEGASEVYDTFHEWQQAQSDTQG